MSDRVVSLFPPHENWGQKERDLPNNEAAERAVLGALLTWNKTLDQVMEKLKPEHFFVSINGKIYDEILRRITLGKGIVDSATLAPWLASIPDAVDIPEGAPQYLADLYAAMIGRDIRSYGEAIRDCWVRREHIRVGERLRDGAYDFNVKQSGHVVDITSLLDKVALDSREYRPLTSFDAAIDKAVADAKHAHEIGGPGGVPIIGFPKLHHSIALLPKEFTIIGGIPGSGKSGIAWQIATYLARHIRDNGLLHEMGGVLGVSLEMSAEMLAARQLSALSGIPTSDMRHGRTTSSQLVSIGLAADEIRGLPMEIIDAGAVSAFEMRLRVKEAKRKFGGKIALCVIDHMNLIKAEQADARHGGAFATGQIADALLAIGKDEEYPTLGLCQLTVSEISKRKDKRPVPGDLRYSGNWFQNADYICLMHRPIQWEPTAPDDQGAIEPDSEYATRVQQWTDRREKLAGKAELIIGKARSDDANFSIPLLFDGKTTSFSESPFPQ